MKNILGPAIEHSLATPVTLDYFSSWQKASGNISTWITDIWFQFDQELAKLLQNWNGLKLQYDRPVGKIPSAGPNFVKLQLDQKCR